MLCENLRTTIEAVRWREVALRRAGVASRAHLTRKPRRDAIPCPLLPLLMFSRLHLLHKLPATDGAPQGVPVRFPRTAPRLFSLDRFVC